TATQQNLTLDIAQELVVNVALTVGESTQEVVVTGEATQINTTTSSLAHVVDEQQVADLPLNGRSFVDLSLMQTGINKNTSYSNYAGYSGTWYNSNGAPARANAYTLDGAIMGSVVAASDAMVDGTALGVDGIREYKVMTNSFSAEYGLRMGSQMTIVTKSGSNQLHGDVFEYLRNSALDARNYFDQTYLLPPTVPDGGDRVAPFRRNQFGGAVGGPIKKDKTFFFTTFEAYKEALDDPNYIGTPNTLPAACHQLVNPGTAFTTLANPTACSSTGLTAASIVPLSIQPILVQIPLPNLPVVKAPQYSYLSSQTTNDYFGQFRIDQNISASDTLFVRYTIDNGNQVRPLQYQQFHDNWAQQVQYLTLAENHVFSANLLNSARLSYSRSNLNGTTIDSLTGPGLSFLPGVPLGTISISGGLTGNFGPDPAGHPINIQNIVSLGDDVFWTKGKHALKFGTLINYEQQYVNENARLQGGLIFSSVSSFVTGKYATFTAPAAASFQAKYMLYDTMGFYAQDDYRVLPRLTLNLGLRWEFNTQPTEKHGRQSYLPDVPYIDTPVSGTIVGDPSYHNFSPRVGFAWNVFGDGKTSVRGGFAILYDIANLGMEFIQAGIAEPPFANAYTVPNTTNATLTLPLPVPNTLQNSSPQVINHDYRQPHMYDFNLAVERQLPFNIALSVAYAGSRGNDLWQITEGNPRCPTQNPYVPQGCSAITLFNGPTQWISPSALTNANNLLSSGATTFAAPATNARLNSFWSEIQYDNSTGESWYNSLQVNLTKRVTHGLEFQSAYTWSKSLDDSQGELAPDVGGSQVLWIENPFNPKSDWGPSIFDIRQNWRFNVLYHLPAIQGDSFAAKALSGWWMGSIVAVQTGYPFSPLIGSDREQVGIFTGANIDRPSYVTSANLAQAQPGAVVYNHGSAIMGSPNEWYNPNMFTLQLTGTIGTVGRDSLTGPGLATWDINVNKDTHLRWLGEQGVLQFRAEVFNLLNKANFGLPNATAFSGTAGDLVEKPLATAGVISTTSTDPREFQFSLKVIF
ncbi:MAG TPA: TonB-dependent receptor, partial [Candidatus Acidoferrales bacterium]|nr:TonB-dependent receptor [Candidatus Acidoferrales bacterium]